MEETLAKFEDLYEAEEYVRQQAIGLPEKRQLLNKNEHIKRLRKLSKSYSSKSHLSGPMSRLKKNWNDVLVRLKEPFDYRIHSIESYTGLDVGSYFRFVSWLMADNFISFIITLLAFVCIPHIVLLTDNLRLSDAGLLTNQSTNNSCVFDPKIKTFEAIDILAADNAMRLGFYGCFDGGSLNIEEIQFKYDMSYAYLLTMMAFFVYWLLDIFSRFTRSVGDTVIKNTILLNKTVFSEKVFTSWPFFLKQKSAIGKKQDQIKLDLSENLNILGQTFTTTPKRVLFLLMTSLLYLTFSAGIGAGIYFFLTEGALEQLDRQQKQLIIATFITIVNFLNPLVCKLFSRLEKMDKVNENLMKLFRFFITQILINLGVLMYSLINNTQECWEAQVGQQIYSLLIMDFILFFLDLLIALSLKLIGRMIWPDFKIEFDTGHYTFSVIYSQALIWLGIYFSPFLVVIQILKLAVIFFCESYFVNYVYKMPFKQGSTAQNNNFFLLISLLTYLVVMGGVVYMNVGIPSSKTCGPLADPNYQTPYDYLIVKLRRELAEQPVIGTLVELVLSPGLIGVLIFSLSVLLYVSITYLSSQRKAMKIIRLELKYKKKEIKLLNQKKKKLRRDLNLTVEAIDESGESEYVSSEQEDDEQEESDQSESSHQVINIEPVSKRHSHQRRYASSTESEYSDSSDQRTSQQTDSESETASTKSLTDSQSASESNEEDSETETESTSHKSTESSQYTSNTSQITHSTTSRSHSTNSTASSQNTTSIRMKVFKRNQVDNLNTSTETKF